MLKVKSEADAANYLAAYGQYIMMETNMLPEAAFALALTNLNHYLGYYDDLTRDIAEYRFGWARRIFLR